MLIKKSFEGEIPENKVMNDKTTTTTDTYSCDYLNKEIASFYIESGYDCSSSGNNFNIVPLTTKVTNSDDSIFSLQSDGTIKILEACDLEISCEGTFGSFTNNVIRRVGIVDSSNNYLTQYMCYQGSYISFSASPVYYKASVNSIIKFVVQQASGTSNLSSSHFLTHVTLKQI